MTNARDTEETTVLATYSSRRDAEMARDYLADADVRAFVSSDDAGGMHPQMQRPHGVKLVGMSGSAQRARSLLDEAGLLPAGDDDRTAPPADATPAAEGWASTVYGLVVVLGALAALLVLLMILLG
jgi:hypothetical protein